MPAINTVNGVDYGLIALYLGIILWVGLYAARQNKSTDDYFRGGGNVPWLLAGVSNWVSGFTAYMFIVAAGVAYQHGPSSLLLYTAGFWGYLLGALLIAPLWRRTRIATPFEFLTRRFSPGTMWFYSVISIPTQVASLGMSIYILCLFGSTALGFNSTTFHVAGMAFAGWELCILIIGAVLIVYSMLGGFWAAVLSDAVQSIIILVMTVIICPVAYLYLGHGEGLVAGMHRLVQEAPAGYLMQLNGPVQSPLFIAAWILSAFVGYNFNWALVQRYQSVADEGGARKMALLCAVLTVIGPLMWVLPAMAARVVFPDIAAAWPAFPEPQNASFIGLALTLLPHGLVGFVVSAILSATLGADNAVLNWLSATVTHDLYVPARKRLGRPAASERHKLAVARWTMFTLGVLGVAVAFQVPRLGGAFEFVAIISSIIAGLMMPVGLGLVYRRTPWWSGLACCIAFIAAITLCLLTGWGKDQAFVRNMFLAIGVNTVVFFLTRIWWNPADARNAEILKLDTDLRTPVLPPADGGAAARRGGSKFFLVLGRLCYVLGGVLLVCRFIVPSTAVVSANLNIVAGLLLLALGWGLCKMGKPAAA